MATDRHAHLLELQALRGLAALAVAIGHALDYYAPPADFAGFAVASKLFNGRAAVVLFFVLSGFVLTRSLARSRFDAAAIGSFYVRRLCRIYPAIWVASLLGLAYAVGLHGEVAVPGAGAGIAGRFRPDRLDGPHILASFAGLLSVLVPQLWSVTVEIVASAALPAVAFLAVRERPRFRAVLAAALALSVAGGDWLPYHLGLYGFDVLVGAWLATARPDRFAPLRRGNAAPILCGIAAAGLVTSQLWPGPYYDPAVHVIEVVLAATIVACLVHAPAPFAAMRSRRLLRLGEVSYSVYLLHYVVICCAAKVLALSASRLGTEPGTATLAVILAAGSVALTLPLAGLVHRWVELPGIRLGRRLTRPRPAAPELGLVPAR